MWVGTVIRWRSPSRCVPDSRVRWRARFAWVSPGPGGCKSRILLPAGLVSSEAASRCVEGCLLAVSSPSSLEPPDKATYPAREGSAFTAPSPPRGLVSAADTLGAASPRCPGLACPQGKGERGCADRCEGSRAPETGLADAGEGGRSTQSFVHGALLLSRLRRHTQKGHLRAAPSGSFPPCGLALFVVYAARVTYVPLALCPVVTRDSRGINPTSVPRVPCCEPWGPRWPLGARVALATAMHAATCAA